MRNASQLPYITTMELLVAFKQPAQHLVNLCDTMIANVHLKRVALYVREVNLIRNAHGLIMNRRMLTYFQCAHFLKRQ